MSNKIATSRFQELIDYFSDAASSISAMSQAQNIAEVYESSVVNNLNNIGANNGVYITPSDIPLEQGEQFIRDSANAHLTKVQASQITQKTHQTIANLEIDAKSKFLGNKTMITKINSKSACFEAVIYDEKIRDYRVSKYSSRSVKGRIHDLSLENNLLVIKPNYTARLINPNRQLIYVYVINYEKNEPEIVIK